MTDLWARVNPGGSHDPTASTCPSDRQHGRVVKAPDSKSGGHCPRRFESGCCRHNIFLFKIFMPMSKNLRALLQEAPALWRRSYYAGVSSDRTNLSPFTKDYRGLALSCDFTVFVACKGTPPTKQKRKKSFACLNFRSCKKSCVRASCEIKKVQSVHEP